VEAGFVKHFDGKNLAKGNALDIPEMVAAITALSAVVVGSG